MAGCGVFIKFFEGREDCLLKVHLGGSVGSVEVVCV